jgi:hypothetical protein
MGELLLKCRITGRDFTVYARERELLERLGYPLPSIHPEERHRRRFSYRNERKLFKNTCHLSGAPQLSIHAAHSGYKVISPALWWSDGWDPRDYGRDIDFSRPFFPQLLQLKRDCPRLALLNTQGENSDYCNNTVSNKNCYLVFGGDYNQDCLYSIFCFRSRDVCDVYWIDNGELIFESINVYNCYALRYCQECYGCRDSAFLYDCRDCAECLFCFGLSNKRYCVFNEQKTEADYKRLLSELRLDSWTGTEAAKKRFEEFCRKQARRDSLLINCEDVSGDNLTNCRNCQDCFDITGPAEDLYHVYLAGYGAKDWASCSTCGHNGELYVECMGSFGGTNVGFSTYSWTSSDILYSDTVTNCRNLFGCTNMQRAEFCILNKQYSEEQYFELRTKLIGHMKTTGEWGEFPPITDSVYPYNTTVAQDIFPLTREQALRLGLSWEDEEVRDRSTAAELPDSIFDVDDSIRVETLICRTTGRPYKIIPKELSLYRKLEIPLPRHAPETRNEMRLARRKTMFQVERHCGGCGKGVRTVWDVEGVETVLCQGCYLKERYSG